MVHLPSLSLQRMSHSAIAIACKIQDDLLSRITQRNLFSPLGWLNHHVLFAIVPGPIDLQQLAEMTSGNGQLLLTCLLDYRMSPVLAGACPTLFLARHSPMPTVHKSVLAQQFLLLLMEARSLMEAKTPLLPADHTHFSSAKPRSKPSYAHGKSEPGAFLH